MAGAAAGLRPAIKFWKVESGTVLYGTNQKGVCWINRKFPVGGSFFNHFKTLVQKDPPNGETEARTPSATAPNLPGLGIETVFGYSPGEFGGVMLKWCILIFFKQLTSPICTYITANTTQR
jgi:hypothetical protein